MAQGTCIVGSCNEPIRAQQRCKSHYGQARRSGEIDRLERPTIADRLADNIDSVVNGCWIWNPRRRHCNGYGTFSIGQRKIVAHRAVYELNEGPIPAGLVLDHLCRNPACVNPAHLEPVTQAENIARGVAPSALAVRFGVCKRGHARIPENMYTPPGDADQSRCALCMQVIRKERWDRRKQTNSIPDRKVKGSCMEADCGREHYARGWCKAHYQRRWRNELKVSAT